MSARRHAAIRYALAFAAGVAVCSAIAFAATAEGLWQTGKTSGTPIFSVRPTGVGLPRVGAEGTVGAGDYAAELKSYHDSGSYGQDLATVDGRARAYLARRLARCGGAARPAARAGSACRKPALVLDIDETSLSNYRNIARTDFTNVVAGLAMGVATADDPPIEPTLKLYRFALRKGISVFFITGRPDNIPTVRTRTEDNLKSAGYPDWAGLSLNPGDLDTVPHKSGERAKIEGDGYHILANVGDQESDLEGGHADRAFKLPNPYYFIGP